MGFRKPGKEALQIAVDVVEQIAIMSPSFLKSIPDDDRAEGFLWQWGRAIEELWRYPEFVFYDAVDVLFKSSDGNNFNITTGNYLRAVHVAAEQAETVPWKREELKRLRELRRRERDEYLKAQNSAE